MSKKEDLIAAQKKLAKQLKKQKEKGKKLDLDKYGIKEVIEPFKMSPSRKESIDNKAMGGKIQTEYRGGGAVNLGNYKGQF